MVTSGRRAGWPGATVRRKPGSRKLATEDKQIIRLLPVLLPERTIFRVTPSVWICGMH